MRKPLPACQRRTNVSSDTAALRTGPIPLATLEAAPVITLRGVSKLAAMMDASRDDVLAYMDTLGSV